MRIWSLQALRFWAALCVVVYHACNLTFRNVHSFGWLGEAGAMFGRVGVDIFFVLSGLIITLTSRGLTPSAFLAKRARRILPLYGVFTVLYLAAHAMAGTLEWRSVLTSLTFWPGLDRMGTPLVPVGWTLCFEALFYAATALVLWRPKLLWPLLAGYGTALLLRSGPALQFLGNPLVLEFLMGVAIAFLPRWRLAAWLIAPALAVSWLFGASGYPPTLDVPDFLKGTLAWSRLLWLGAPAAVVVWGTLQLDVRKGVQSELGDASYAIYLSHLPVVGIVVWALCRVAWLPPDVIALGAVIPAVLLGWRIHVLFEKPLLGWLGAPRAWIAPARAGLAARPAEHG